MSRARDDGVTAARLDRAATLGYACGVVVSLLVALGLAVDPRYLLEAAALAVLAALGLWNRGVLAALLLLLVLNGVPFINTRPSPTGGNVLADAAFAGLVTVLLPCAAVELQASLRDRAFRLATGWAVVFLGWWAWEIGRSMGPTESPLAAVQFGRDFMYFGFFIPLALAGIRRREHVLAFALTLAGGATLYSVGQILSVLSGADLSWLVHIGKTATFDGLVRIYSPMNDLIIAVFPFATGVALLGPRGPRRWAASVAILTGVANALSLTRAVYGSEAVALVIVGLLYMVRTGWAAQRIRRAGLAAVACVAILVFLGGSASSGSRATPVVAVASWAAQGVTDVQSQGGNVGYRLRQAGFEVQAVGGHWLMGLGLRTPDSFWVEGERDGSLRNSDLGSLSIVTTMGVIGLLLTYAPLVAGFLYVLTRTGPVQFGGAMYFGAAFIASITLGTLSSVSGLLVLGCALVICVNWPDRQGRARDVRESVRASGGL